MWLSAGRGVVIIANVIMDKNMAMDMNIDAMMVMMVTSLSEEVHGHYTQCV